MLRIQDYSKSYNGRKILSFKEYTFNNGIFLVQGTNGSGKTTLFKSISGITKFEGDCFIENIGLKKSPVEYRRLVNYCEAEPQFPSFLTGKELISFVSKCKGTDKIRIDKLIGVFGIDQYWKTSLGTYSSGMLKKIALVIAFCGVPKLIMLDEPFTTIDQQSANILCELINSFHLEGCSFILSAHQIKDSIPIHFDHTLLIEHQTLQVIQNDYS